MNPSAANWSAIWCATSRSAVRWPLIARPAMRCCLPTSKSSNSTRTLARDHGRPRVGPSMTQNSGPIGRATRAMSQGSSSCQPQSSIPTSRRRPPLPRRTAVSHDGDRDPPHAAPMPRRSEGQLATTPRPAREAADVVPGARHVDPRAPRADGRSGDDSPRPRHVAACRGLRSGHLPWTGRGQGAAGSRGRLRAYRSDRAADPASCCRR